MPILIIIIKVFFGIFDFRWIMGHLNNLSIINRIQIHVSLMSYFIRLPIHKIKT